MYLNQFCKLGLWTESATKKTQNIKGASSSIYIGVLLTSTHKEIHNEYIKNKDACTYICVHTERGEIKGTADKENTAKLTTGDHCTILATLQSLKNFQGVIFYLFRRFELFK